MDVIKNKPETKDLEYIAVKTDNDQTIISRGYDVDQVIQKAKKSGFKFMLTYKPSKDQNFIY